MIQHDNEVIQANINSKILIDESSIEI